MNREDKLNIVLSHLKYQLAFNLLAEDYAMKFLNKEDLCMEISQNERYWTKEVEEHFLSKATDIMINTVNEIYKDKNKEEK